MATKAQIVEQIKVALGMDFGNRTVAMYIDQSFNTVAGQLFKQNPNQYDFYAKTYIIPITHAHPHSYAILPVPVIQTTDNANGVRQIYPMCEDELAFAPMPKSGHQIYNKLTVGKVCKVVGYNLKTDRIEFLKNLPDDIKEVKAELVRPFSAYDDEEEVPLPDGSADLIIQMVMQMMNKQDVKTNIYK